MAPSGLVKLRAHDPEDMRVVAAWLQDALVALGEVAYLKREKRFIMVANRFKWERTVGGALPKAPEPLAAGDARFVDDAGEPPFQRVNCGVCFDRVRGVHTRGLDLKNKDHILNLLTIESEPRRITLQFSGNAVIRLDVSAIACHLEDLGEPWPTRWRPSHDEAQEADEDQAGRRG